MEDLIPVREAADLRTLPDDERERTAFFPAEESFSAVEWDIARATRRVEVYCAFLSPTPVRTWGKVFAEARQRSIPVTVFTRPDGGDRSNIELIRHLTDTECHVELREAMHEKVVVVDDILWHGSLNLLAHSRSTDLMMRIVSAPVCDDVRRLLDRARPTRPAPSGRSPSDVDALVYLKVPYPQKDEAKRLGARWDRGRKSWYVDPRTTPIDAFTQWRDGNGRD